MIWLFLIPIMFYGLGLLVGIGLIYLVYRLLKNLILVYKGK